MFQISDEDLLWDDDFPVDDIIENEGTDSIYGNKLLSVESLPAQGETGLTSLKHDALSIASTSFSRLSAGDHCLKSNNQAEDLPRFCKRKFPGPAGILPPYSPSVVLDIKLAASPDVAPQPKSPNIADAKDGPSQLSWSQAASDDVFKSPQWKALMSDLGQDSESLIAKFSIKSALLKASRKLLHRGKIPLIIGVIDAMEMQGSDASIIIRDPSGKMNGALHRDLFKDQSTTLQIGSVLVLRQVSVISPSPRTHYLNITPGNVALIYSANKEAAVSKQFTSGFEIEPSISETQFLSQIIKTSEQELSDAVKNCHQGSRTHALENLSNGFNIKYLSPVMPRDPLLLKRNQMNVTPAGRSSSLFNCSPQSLTTVTCGRVVTPPNSVKMTETGSVNYRNKTVSYPTHIFGNRFPLQNGTPMHNHCISHADRISPPALQHSKSEFINPNIASSACGLPGKFVGRSQFSSCQILSKDTSHDTASHIISGSNEMPHEDDEMLLSFSDDVLNENLDGDNCRNKVHTGLNTHEEFGRKSGMIDNSKCGNVINEVFSDCRKENERLNNNFKKENLNKRSSLPSNLDDQSAGSGSNSDIIITRGSGKNSPALLQADMAVKKFSFKRSLPASDVLHLAVPVKQSACDIVLPAIDTAKRKTYIHSSSLSVTNSSIENCDRIQVGIGPLMTVAEHSAITSAVTRVGHCVPSVPLAGPRVQQTAPCSVFSNTSVNLKQAVCSDGLAESSCGSKRDSGVAGHSSMFQVWDSDLSDEMLLSQLSDEF